jgi:hypothetical protein
VDVQAHRSVPLSEPTYRALNLVAASIGWRQRRSLKPSLPHLIKGPPDPMHLSVVPFVAKSSSSQTLSSFGAW